jgi:hypothetical protein
MSVTFSVCVIALSILNDKESLICYLICLEICISAIFKHKTLNARLYRSAIIRKIKIFSSKF